MITAVDTNVLIDVFAADPRFGERSGAAVRRCLAEGSLIASDVVWAEVSGAFSSTQGFEDATQRIGVRFSALDSPAAMAAGAAWRAYQARSGERHRVIADFLIGAHAQAQADRLLTRDRGFYRTYFSGLAVLDPGS
ncbi:type II toxin-antitoxin system VapC family toxin [soil metagenome]